jgi:hypothetical protein
MKMKDKGIDFIVLVGVVGLVFLVSNSYTLFRAAVLLLLVTIIYQLERKVEK